MRRRDLLAWAGASAAFGAAPARAGRARLAQDAAARFTPVDVRPERVIRTVVGLRPYRRSGFVLKAERFGRKTLVHNYGHGGAGVTMSWGCSTYAADLASAAEPASVAVLGAGVMGLTTGLILARRGARVTIYAADLPPDTTSNVAGALWLPTTLFRESAVDDVFLGLFRETARLSQRRFQHLANDPAYGVYWIRHHQFSRRAPAAPYDDMPGGFDLYPGFEETDDPARTAGYAHAASYHTLMIDPDIYLRALMRDFQAAGGRLVVRRFATDSAVARLRERVVVNCTGLGAKDLFGDDELQPVRGQLTLLLPQPEIDYGYVTGDARGVLYMFPRRSSIVLGGTQDYSETDLTPDPAQKTRMLSGHADIARRLAGS